MQVALAATGVAGPRDSDMQERALGEAIAADATGLRRGDLMFWKGHVAIVRDADTVVHASAFNMAVAIEPIGVVNARLAGEGSPLRTVRRLSSRSPDR